MEHIIRMLIERVGPYGANHKNTFLKVQRKKRHMNLIKASSVVLATTFSPSFASAGTVAATAFAGNCSFGTEPQTVRSEIPELFIATTPLSQSPTRSATSTGPVMASSNDAGCVSESFAVASLGVLGIRGNAATNRRGFVATSNARAHSISENLFLVPSLGFTRQELVARWGTNIEISPNLVITGSIEPVATGTATIFADVALRGRNSAGGFSQGIDGTAVTTSVGNGVTTGDFGSFSERIGENATLTLDPSQPFELELNLSGNATASNFGSLFGSSNYQSFESLRFVTDGPAFNLPDGYTIFSSQLNIFDNQWIDPRIDIPTSPAPVPLPAGGLLLLSALGVLAAKRRSH